MAWLIRGDRVLASLEVPSGPRAKGRGLLGRDGLVGRDGMDGAMLLERTRSVHSFGMKFDLDIAFLDADGVVIRTMRLKRNRITLPVWGARSVLEAEAGCFGSWDLHIGDELSIRA